MAWMGALLAMTLGAAIESDTGTLREAEAIERYALRERLDTYGAGARQARPGTVVEVVQGDLHVPGDLLVDGPYALERVDAIRARAPGDRVAAAAHQAIGLVVTGALTVDGAIINADVNGGPFLLVLGETRARAIFSGGAEMVFAGYARVADAVVGCYNDGSVAFLSGLEAPLAISEDHEIKLLGQPAPELIDYFNGWGDAALLKFRLDPAIEIDEVEELDAEQMLLPRIRRGERVLKPR
jgi:hypothetical protein